MPSQTPNRHTNEQWITQMFQWIAPGGRWFWEERGLTFFKSPEGKILPELLKGYIELSTILGRQFFLDRVIMPTSRYGCPPWVAAQSESEIMLFISQQNGWFVPPPPPPKKKTRRGGSTETQKALII